MIIDISESMNANDLSPNRLESAKKIIIDFIKKQETNRLGLVLFAGKPFQSIPLTFDYNIFTQITERISTANINQNYPELSGTAIGDALLMGSTLFDLENQKEKDREKVIILLTDGEANKGAEPKIVAKYLNEKGIKIYTVGIGSLEGGEITYDDGFFKQSYFVEPLNEKDLLEITKITKGEYFRAIDNKSLENIFEKLEKLEKKDIEMETKKEFTTNYSFFSYLLIFSLIILMSLLIYNPEE